MTRVPLGELMPSGIPSLNPAEFPNETFELWSIPAFDAGRPEIVTGANIGSSKKRVEPGDVLLSRIVPHIRRSWVVTPYKGARQIGSGEWITFRSSRFHPPYLRHVLVSDEFHACFMQTVAGVGGSLLRARPDGVKEIEVPLPPLGEQQRIATILDQVDSLRRLRQRAIDRLNSLGQAIFYEMFGDPVTNSREWPTRQISDVATVITGNTPSRQVSEYYGSHIEWIKSDNINTPHYYLTRADEGLSGQGKQVARTVPAGSILVTCIAGSPECIGNAALTNREVAFNQQINALVPLDGDPHFLYGQIRYGKHLVQQASTAGMKGMVSKSRFERIALIWPPISLQRQFADRIQAVERITADHRVSSEKLNALFSSLQHRAFRGEL